MRWKTFSPNLCFLFFYAHNSVFFFYNFILPNLVNDNNNKMQRMSLAEQRTIFLVKSTWSLLVNFDIIEFDFVRKNIYSRENKSPQLNVFHAKFSK